MIFGKLPVAISPGFLIFNKSNPLIFEMCFMRRIVAYLCPNMINFDGVDFSERRSEEVMFLLTLGVYKLIKYLLENC